MWKYEKKLQFPVNIKNKNIQMAKYIAMVANGGKKIYVKKIIRTNNTKSNWESMYKNITK